MTRGEMRTIIRRRCKDPNSVAWTDAQVDDELNRAATEVARQLSRYQLVNFINATETFTTTGGDQTYEMTATNVSRIYTIQRTDTTPYQKVRIISPLDELDTDSNWWGGYWRVFLSRSTTTGKYTINFPNSEVNAGMTFTINYIATLTEIATGSGSDSSSYAAIPTDYHELIVQQAVVNLLGQESSIGQIAAMKLDELRQEMVKDASVTSNPDFIQQEFYP